MRYPGNYGFVAHTPSDDDNQIEFLSQTPGVVSPAATINVWLKSTGN
jgi:inorganic pyrophosphatase